MILDSSAIIGYWKKSEQKIKMIFGVRVRVY